MSIRLDTDKCWVNNPDSLKIKRYLSETRTYFREGAWIREYFSRFFPDIKVGDDGNLFFDLTSLDPVCICLKGSSIDSVKIPKELLEEFQLAANKYQSRLEKGGLNFNEDVSSKELTLPDPDIFPNLYWLAETEDGPRLIILWGLQSEIEEQNISIQLAEKKLIEQFSGRAVVKKRQLKPVSIPKTKEPEPQPKIEEKKVPKATAKESIKKVAPPKEKKPEKKLKPKPAPVKKSKPSPSPVPAEAQNKGAFFKILVRFALLPIIILLLITELSFRILGSDVISKGIPVGQQNGSATVISLKKGQTATFYDGSTYSAEESDANLTVSQFPKPGNYAIPITNSSTGEISEIVEVNYDNIRNGMNTGPVAALFLDNRSVKVGAPVTASVSNSFQKEADVNTNYQISWGDGDLAFQPISNPGQPLTHSYQQPGTYKVTLLVKDNKDRWDHDVVEAYVVDDELVEPQTFNQAPVVDMEVVAIVPVENREEVTLDLSNSYDVDGQLKEILVDWGDDTETQVIKHHFGFISHQYRSGSNRVWIKAIAEDKEGLKSSKPSVLYLDFQSSEMNNTDRFEKPEHREERKAYYVADGVDTIRLEKTIFGKLRKNKQRIQFRVMNPVSAPNTPLVNLQWELKIPGGAVQTIEGSNFVEIQVVDGVYQLKIEAKDTEGNTYVLNHRFSTYISKEMSPISKLMNWFTHKFPYISLSHYLSR